MRPDIAIESLHLSPKAKEAAYTLKEKFPHILFTSGRRDKAGQAHAMATNVVKNRKWIEQTYKPSLACLECQKWVDYNPQSQSVSEIATGLLCVLNALSDDQLCHLSKHLSGDAFDVQPLTGPDAEPIKQFIRQLPGSPLFLDKEGGLLRWHVQF